MPVIDFATCACWLVLTTFSHHVDPAGMRQYNPGVGVEVNDWHVGEYLNSLNRKTWYVGKEWATEGPFKAGILLGAATGYKPVIGLHVLPVPVPFLSYEGKRVGANLEMMPNPIQWNKSAIALQIKWRI